ncbi:MAG: DNA repair exonuclease [Candidatus Pacearchaeota archaeon]|nr:DNA repair exonuclease [Candidatus Pacearchaeota archaeon]
MVKFAHISDVHLGGWKQQPMQDLNFESFKKTIDICVNSKLDFILFAGDIFDSAYPSIEILKETFAQFKRLKEARIPVFIIAGSHDYSVSGKTFLDVLEKAGFCKNVTQIEEKDNKIILSPVVYGNVAIYGYPGRKSGLEIDDLRRVKLNEAPGMFKIFMLHTTIDKAKGGLPIDAIETHRLPYADYYALGHLHIDFKHENFIYPGPIFPNNFAELEDLEHGSFYLVDTESNNNLEKIKIKLKDLVKLDIKITNAHQGTSKIINELENFNLEDKIILLRVRGEIEQGKNSDIKFTKIEEYAKDKGAYFLLKNTHDLRAKDNHMNFKIRNNENIEEETINAYIEENPSKFDSSILFLMNSLSLEKQEGEKSEIFNNRVIEEARRILKF